MAASTVSAIAMSLAGELKPRKTNGKGGTVKIPIQASRRISAATPLRRSFLIVNYLTKRPVKIIVDVRVDNVYGPLACDRRQN
ncbi:hypothetical protein N7507_003871 [Penicillium longicatenatum]|nr:hypothetical protein N7507_003871 [Penicillium longicatenatum]